MPTYVTIVCLGRILKYIIKICNLDVQKWYIDFNIIISSVFKEQESFS